MSKSAHDTTILVVDDDLSLRSALGEFLEDQDWVTLVASDGDDALHIVESYPEDIDLLVTDVMMAGMDGCTLAAQVAAERPNIKILYMSGRFTDSDNVRLALREAGRFFLAKPFGRREFIEMVETALRRAVDPSDAFAVILGNPLVTAQATAVGAHSGSERSARYAVELGVRYRWKMMSDWKSGRTRNISRTGIEFDVEPPIPDRAPLADDPGIDLRVELPFPGARRADVVALGRVTRFEPSDASDGTVGIAVAVTGYHTDIRR